MRGATPPRRARTLDVAVECCVVIVVARREREEVFARFGRAVAKELDLDVAQRGVQCDRHAGTRTRPRPAGPCVTARLPPVPAPANDWSQRKKKRKGKKKET
jgi:hypothetical protein